MNMLLYFQLLSHCLNSAIIGLVCRLLAGESHGKIQTLLPAVS